MRTSRPSIRSCSSRWFEPRLRSDRARDRPIRITRSCSTRCSRLLKTRPSTVKAARSSGIDSASRPKRKKLGARWGDLLRHEDASVRKLAIAALPRDPLTLKPLVPALEECLTNSDFGVRAAAAERLWEIHHKPEQVVPVLVDCLQKAFSENRLLTVRALAAVGPAAKTTVTALKPLIYDPDDNTRLAAAKALWRISGDATAVKPLVEEFARRSKNQSAGEASYRAAVVGLWKEMGPAAAEALPALFEAAAAARAKYIDVQPIVDAIERIDPQGKAFPAELSQYQLRVVTMTGKPVSGVAVVPSYVSFYGGGDSVDEKLIQTVKTDQDGLARLVLHTAGGEQKARRLRRAALRGIYGISLRVDHPDHPIWHDYLKWDGDRRIVLADSTTVEVRARREHDPAWLPRVYPVFHSTFEDLDRSERDGLVTVRRIDLSSAKAPRWMRAVHIPEKGPVVYSALVDLKGRKGNPLRLDLTMKPGARVEGRLAAEVPRPVKNGHVVAQIVHGANFSTNWYWSVISPVAADGTFVLESVPPDENLQLIALCDGWAAPSPTLKEVDAYKAEHAFPEAKYEGPVSFFIYPRLYRLDGSLTHAVVPMKPTATCEVTVSDDSGQPIPGASIEFWPNARFFDSGSQIFGDRRDSLTQIRSHLTAGSRHPSDDLNTAEHAFSAKTDAHGIAIVRNLPLGETAKPNEPKDLYMNVSLAGYMATSNTATLAKLLPGKTARVTVTLRRINTPVGTTMLGD